MIVLLSPSLSLVHTHPPTSVEPRTLYVDTREGPAPATIPGDVVAAVVEAAGTEEAAEAALELAALILVRAGVEAGTALLRHWMAHDPRTLLDADPLLGATLAGEPEILTGPLVGPPSAAVP